MKHLLEIQNTVTKLYRDLCCHIRDIRYDRCKFGIVTRPCRPDSEDLGLKV